MSETNERLGSIREAEHQTYHDGLGSDAVYLLQAFKGHGVHLSLQELGVESVYVCLETRYVYLSTVLSLHFVSGMNWRPRRSRLA